MTDKRVFIFEGYDRAGRALFIRYMKEELEKKGKNVFVFKATKPSSFDNCKIDANEKSLVQLAKFQDEYVFIKVILDKDKDNYVILDGSSFGEYVWSEFFRRVGKFTSMLNSPWFFKEQRDVLDKAIFINYTTSDKAALKSRIEEIEEDSKDFKTFGRTLEESIEEVNKLFDELGQLVQNWSIDFKSIDSSKFKNLENMKKNAVKFANKFC